MALGPLQPSDPATIGGYRVSARLGAGGMGVVYLASDTANRPLALKVIRDEIASDPDFRARFRREVAACQAVDGQCTAAVVAYDADADQPWLATEYIAGPSLQELVRGDGPLPEQMISSLAVGLAEALAAVHRAGLVHRDLKPANVLMAPHGPRVIDFGIAAAVDGSSATRSGLVVGSPGYLSPEQVLTDAKVGPPTDVFAWALTILYAATGRPPFGTGRPDAMFYRVLHESPDTSPLPESLRPLVTKALSREPSARPTAVDLLAALTSQATDPEQAATQILASTWHLPNAPTGPVAVAPARTPTAAVDEGTPVEDQPTSLARPGGTALPALATPVPPSPALPARAPLAPARERTAQRLYLLAGGIIVAAIVASFWTYMIRGYLNERHETGAPPASSSAADGASGAAPQGPLETLPNGIPAVAPYRYDSDRGSCAATSADAPPLTASSDILTRVSDPATSASEAEAEAINTRDPGATASRATPLLITVVSPSGAAYYDEYQLFDGNWSEVYFPTDFTDKAIDAEVGTYTVIWATHAGTGMPRYFACGGFSYTKG